MEQAMQAATADHQRYIQTMKKEVRQHVVEKEDAVLEACHAREELLGIVKKLTSKINQLERKLAKYDNEKIGIETREVAHKESVEQFERASAKERRKLEVEQGDLLKQQTIAHCELESLANQRAFNRTRRRDMETSHGKALDKVQTTSARDK
jgi:hypothetical protein